MALLLNVSSRGINNALPLLEDLRVSRGSTGFPFIFLNVTNSRSLPDFLASTPGFNAALGCSVNGVLVLPYLDHLSHL